MESKYARALSAAADRYEQRDYPGAIAQYKTALDLRPADPPALCGLGNALYAMGDEVKAIGAYSESVRDSPRWAGAHTCRFYLGWLLLRAKSLDEARVQFEILVKEDPSDCRARANLAFIAVSQGRTDEALRLKDTPVPCPDDVFQMWVEPQPPPVPIL